MRKAAVISPTTVEQFPPARLVELSSELKARLQDLLETAVVVADADFGHVQLLDAAGHLKIVTHRGFEDWWINYWQTAAGDGHGARGAALATGEREIVEDVLTSPVFTNPADRETMVRAGIRAVQSTPVRSRSGQALGTFSTHCREARCPDAKTLKVLDLLAEHVAQAVERALAELIRIRVGAEYQAIFKNAPVGIAQMDPVQRSLLKVNPAVCAMLGYTEDELVGQRLEAITHPSDLAANLRDVADLVAGATSSFYIIKQYLHKNGSIVWGEVHVVNLPGIDGGPGTSMAVISDITERLRLEKEREQTRDELAQSHRILKAERHFLDTVVENQQAQLIVLDNQGRLVRFNRAVEEMHGEACQQALGTRNWLRSVGPDEPARLRQTLEALAAGQREIELEVQVFDAARQPHAVLLRVTAIRDEVGQVQNVIGSGLDITELRRAEATARSHLDDVFRMNRLETANELASVLAHELNQPLAAIEFYVVAARHELAKTDIDRAELMGLLSRISELGLKTGEVIQHSRRFFKRGEIEADTQDLNTVLRSAMEVMQPTARRQNVRLTTELQADLPEVWGVAVHIEQVLLNLLRNAVEAIAEQGSGIGEVTVRSQSVGRMARVTVSDSGPGLTEAQAEHVFHAMRSSKADGLGMGLRISRNLMEANEGELWAEAHAPGGIFNFEVPLT